MPQKTDNASVASLIGLAVESDPALQKRVRALINGMIEHAEYVMQWGTPADKSILMRAAVPAMMKAMQRTEEDAVTKRHRAALERIYGKMRGDAPSPDGPITPLDPDDSA